MSASELMRSCSMSRSSWARITWSSTSRNSRSSSGVWRVFRSSRRTNAPVTSRSWPHDRRTSAIDGASVGRLAQRRRGSQSASSAPASWLHAGPRGRRCSARRRRRRRPESTPLRRRRDRLEIGPRRRVRRQPVDPLRGDLMQRHEHVLGLHDVQVAGHSLCRARQAQNGEDLPRELLGLLALVALLEVLADQRVPVERVREGRDLVRIRLRRVDPEQRFLGRRPRSAARSRRP